MDSESKIQSLIENIAKLELSQVNITQEMLSSLIKRMQDAHISSIPFDEMLLELNRMHFGSIQNTNVENGVDTSIDSSISSTFSYQSQDSKSSPPLSFKFKTPKKATFSKNIKKISTGKKSTSPKIKINFNPVSHSPQDSISNNFKNGVSNEQSHCYLGPFSDPTFPPLSTPLTLEIEISSPSSLPNLYEFGSSNFTRDLIPECTTTTTKTHLTSFFNLDQQDDGNNHPPIIDDKVIAEASYANTSSIPLSSTKVDILSHNEQVFDQNYNNANRMNIVNDNSNQSNIDITKNSNSYGFAVCLEDENNNRRRLLSKTKSGRNKQKPIPLYSKTLPSNLFSTTASAISSAQTSTKSTDDSNNIPSNSYDTTARAQVTSPFKDNSLFTNNLSSTLPTYPNNNNSSPEITPAFTYSLPKTLFTNTRLSSESMPSQTFHSTSYNNNNNNNNNISTKITEVETSLKNISISSNNEIPQNSTVPITVKPMESMKDSDDVVNDDDDNKNRPSSPIMTSSPMNIDSNILPEDNDTTSSTSTTTTSQSQPQSNGLNFETSSDNSEFRRPWYPTVVPGKLNNAYSSRNVVIEPTIISSQPSNTIPIFTTKNNATTTTTPSTLFSGFQQQFVPAPPSNPSLATSLFQTTTSTMDSTSGTSINDNTIDESRLYSNNPAPVPVPATTMAGNEDTDKNTSEFIDGQKGDATFNQAHDYLSKSATFSFKANIDANNAISSSHSNTMGAKKKSKLKLMARIKKKPSASTTQNSINTEGYVDGVESNEKISSSYFSESDPMMTSPSATTTSSDNNNENKSDPATTSFSTPDRKSGSNPYGLFQYGDNDPPFMHQSQSIPTFDFSTTSVRSNEKRPLADLASAGANTLQRQSSNDKSTASSTYSSRGKPTTGTGGRANRYNNNPQSPTGRLAAEAAMAQDSGEESEAAMKARLCQLADLLRKQGKELYANEAYERALDAFTKALKTAPATWQPRPAVLGNRAATFMMMERYVEAALDCESAIAEDPSFFRLHARMGRALLRLGDLFGSQNAFNAVIDTIASKNKNNKSKLGLSEQETADYAADEASIDDAKSGLSQVKKARNLLGEIPELLKQQPQKDYKLALKKTEELLQLCPQMRAAQTLKAKALSQCQYWTDTKLYIERVSLLVHESIQSRNVHSAAQLPSPKPEDLVWTEIGAGMVRINLASIVQALLFMGPDMAQCYIKALKNNDAARYCCGDVMDNIISILLSVASHVGSTSSWAWVNEEEAKTRAMIEAKSLADKHFRLKAFQLAYDYYSEALKCDADAHRLNAVLFANRAAASMNMKNYNDAISDCHYAIIRDPVYIKAFLRRARAYRALGNVPASARDYKRYLMSMPPPSDLQEVQGELDAMEQSQFVRAARDASRMRSESARSAWAEFSSEYSSQRGPSGSGSGDGDEDTGGANARPTSSKSYSSDPDYMKFTGSKPYGRSTSTDDAANNNNEDNQNTRSTSGSTSNANTSGSTNNSSRRKAGASNQSKFRNSSASWEWAREAREEDGRSQVPPSAKPRDSRSRTTGGSNSSHHHNSHSAGGSNYRYGSSNRDPNIDPFTATDPDLYAVLGVSENVSDRDLKVAYRRLALRYHPDKNKDAGAEDKFKILTSAYSTLSDKTTRRTYDLTRSYSGRF